VKAGSGPRPQASPLPLGEGQGVRAGSGPRFYVLDGTRSDAPELGFWNRLATVIPHTVKLAGVRDAAQIMAEIAAELAARQQQQREDSSPIYLFIYNFSRFRDLRKEDDFGYSSDDGKPQSPARQFAAILREGSPLGIHTLVWCDTYSNVSRMLDRQTMKDFEMRVLFQMNANDSSSLMDAPDASRLGVHRAIYYDEGQGRAEKLCPYGLPSAEWLDWVKQQLHNRPTA
jgi:DNA segregation ATPase FtsK/SpoIIIE, S-DNA-T family